MFSNMYDKLKEYIDVKINNIQTSLKQLFDDYKVKDVGDNVDSIKHIYNNKDNLKLIINHMDQIDDVSKNMNTVIDIGDSMNKCLADIKLVNNLLELKIGNTYINDNGHLNIYAPDSGNIPEIDDKGHLILDVN